MKQIFILLLIIILLKSNNANTIQKCNLKYPEKKEDCTSIVCTNEEECNSLKCCYEEFRLIKINNKKTCRMINKDEYKKEIKRLKKYGAKAVKVDCKSGFYFLNNLLLILIIFLLF